MSCFQQGGGLFPIIFNIIFWNFQWGWGSLNEKTDKFKYWKSMKIRLSKTKVNDFRKKHFLKKGKAGIRVNACKLKFAVIFLRDSIPS